MLLFSLGAKVDATSRENLSGVFKGRQVFVRQVIILNDIDDPGLCFKKKWCIMCYTHIAIGGANVSNKIAKRN